MTIEQFHDLAEEDQLSAIMRFGHLLAQHMEENARMFLYKLGTFYVTASYAQPGDQLTSITSFLEVDQSVPHFRKQLITVHPAERT